MLIRTLPILLKRPIRDNHPASTLQECLFDTLIYRYLLVHTFDNFDWPSFALDFLRPVLATLTDLSLTVSHKRSGNTRICCDLTPTLQSTYLTLWQCPHSIQQHYVHGTIWVHTSHCSTACQHCMRTWYYKSAHWYRSLISQHITRQHPIKHL